MTSNYNGVQVEWTAEEAAKIAEIKARREWAPAPRVEVQKEPERQKYMDGVERKVTRSKAMYWLGRCGLSRSMIADLFSTDKSTVQRAVERIRGGKVDNSRLR